MKKILFFSLLITLLIGPILPYSFAAPSNQKEWPAISSSPHVPIQESEECASYKVNVKNSMENAKKEKKFALNGIYFMLQAIMFTSAYETFCK